MLVIINKKNLEKLNFWKLILSLHRSGSAFKKKTESVPVPFRKKQMRIQITEFYIIQVNGTGINILIKKIWQSLPVELKTQKNKHIGNS